MLAFDNLENLGVALHGIVFSCYWFVGVAGQGSSEA